MNQRTQGSTKAPYERPKVQVIELKAEETLAKPCKVRLGRPGPLTGCGRNNCSGRLGS